jgi:hypothetical protein
MRFREHRFPCEVPARLDHGDKRLTVSIVNISPHGMRLSGVEGVPVGSVAIVRVLGEAIAGEVRWTRGTLAGLRIGAEISPRVLAAIRQARSFAARANPSGAALAPRPPRGRCRGLVELR